MSPVFYRGEDGRETTVELDEPRELIGFMTPEDLLSWQIRRAALLTILNLETRSFEEIAASLGCTRAAISKAYQAISRGTGFEGLFRRVSTRKANAEAARRRWDKRKSAPSELPPGAEREEGEPRQ